MDHETLCERATTMYYSKAKLDDADRAAMTNACYQTMTRKQIKIDDEKTREHVYILGFETAWALAMKWAEFKNTHHKENK